MKLFVLIAAFLLVSCATPSVNNTTSTQPSTTLNNNEVTVKTVSQAQLSTSNYDVNYREVAATIDGVLEEEVWKPLGAISGSFLYPWEKVEAPFTEFKAYHDNTNFYFSFVVKDQAVVSEEQWKEDESTVDNEDRVELFFASGSVDKPVEYKIPLYYATEVDPLGRAHDYSIKYYREFDSKFNFEGAKNAATIVEDGYIVEGYIPLATLKALNLFSEDQMIRVGVFRAEFTKNNDELIMQWISWVDPKTEVPDFHVDSAFGQFRFLGLK